MEHLRFVYGPSEGRTVQLRPVGRPYGSLYGSSMVCRKAAWFTYGPSEGRTVYFTDHKQDLRPAWSAVWKAARKVPRKGISYVFLYFMVLFLCISFVLYGFIKANYGGYTQAVLFLSTASV